MVELNLNHCPNCGSLLSNLLLPIGSCKGCSKCDVLFREINYCGEPFTVSQLRDDDPYRWTLYGNRKDE